MSEEATSKPLEPAEGAGSSPNGSTPNERATTFQAVQGPQPEQHSGVVLLVDAYALVFVLLVAWVALIWRKARTLAARVAELEHVLDAAAQSGKGASSS